MTIKAAKRIFNSDKICRSYSDLNFGVTFSGTQCTTTTKTTSESEANQEFRKGGDSTVCPNIWQLRTTSEVRARGPNYGLCLFAHKK